MKKLLCLMLVLLMVFGIVACGGDGDSKDPSADNGGFQIGYGKVDITPEYPVHLECYGDEATRISKGALSPIYAIAIVLKSANGNTVAMITTDLTQGSRTIMNELRPMITERFGLSNDQILIGGTHNHNGPDFGFNDKNDQEYKTTFKNGVVEAVQLAMDDLAPASAEIGRTETENLTFVRRYYLANGQMTGDNHNYNHNSTITSHETEADEEIQLVRFKREGDHKDIVMVNWQSHAAMHGHTDMLSSDFVGPLRDKVEKQLDVNCVFYQGCTGNLNPFSRIPGESVFTGTSYDNAVALGEMVADYAIKALTTDGVMKAVKTGSVNNKQDKFIGAESFDEINFVTCGELSFITIPTEFFDVLGRKIKDNTPYSMTVLMDFHCGDGGYMATKEAYENGGYEPRNTRYRAGEGELWVQKYLDVLGQMHAAENP